MSDRIFGVRGLVSVGMLVGMIGFASTASATPRGDDPAGGVVPSAAAAPSQTTEAPSAPKAAAPRAPTRVGPAHTAAGAPRHDSRASARASGGFGGGVTSRRLPVAGGWHGASAHIGRPF